MSAGREARWSCRRSSGSWVTASFSLSGYRAQLLGGAVAVTTPPRGCVQRGGEGPVSRPPPAPRGFHLRNGPVGCVRGRAALSSAHAETCPACASPRPPRLGPLVSFTASCTLVPAADIEGAVGHGDNFPRKC